MKLLKYLLIIVAVCIGIHVVFGILAIFLFGVAIGDATKQTTEFSEEQQTVLKSRINLDSIVGVKMPGMEITRHYVQEPFGQMSLFRDEIEAQLTEEISKKALKAMEDSVKKGKWKWTADSAYFIHCDVPADIEYNYRSAEDYSGYYIYPYKKMVKRDICIDFEN